VAEDVWNADSIELSPSEGGMLVLSNYQEYYNVNTENKPRNISQILDVLKVLVCNEGFDANNN
jgi:hypothetical protein